MFNAKQALERIRKTKPSKQQHDHILDEQQHNNSLFPQNDYEHIKNVSNSFLPREKPSSIRQQSKFNNHIASQSVEQRILKLEHLVSQLSGKLGQSDQTIQELKKQNNTLETHILKLEHQNSQLKNSHKFSELKHSLSSKLNHSISGLSENSKLITSFHDKSQIKKTQSKVIDDEVFSPEVQDALQEIKKQPINNILRRKEHNFRALKNASKDSLLKGQKALRQLANLHKNYGKHYKKPTLIINLQDADFQ